MLTFQCKGQLDQGFGLSKISGFSHPVLNKVGILSFDFRPTVVEGLKFNSFILLMISRRRFSSR